MLNPAETRDRTGAASGGPVFVPGHFGEWLQGSLGPSGPIVLVTLACPVRGVRAWQSGPGPFSLVERPMVLGADRAKAFLAGFGRAPSGRYRVIADLPPGGGTGMSTAALLALAGAAGCGHGPELAEACLAAEGASDPLMLPAPDAVLWAPREARVVAGLPAPREAEILGGFFGPPQRTVPADTAFPDVTDLVARWRTAPTLPGLAAIASLSAERCTALRGPTDDPVPQLARQLGALGHVRAHTGSARALIFAPGGVPDGAEAALSASGLTGIVRFRTGRRG